MEGLTPRTPNSPASLLQATDHARALLRRAQILLAVLAVLVAVAVGVLAAASRGAAATPHHPETVQAELLEAARPAESTVAGVLVPVAAQWIDPRGQPYSGTVLAPAGLPSGATVTVVLDGGGGTVMEPPRPVAGPAATGLLAGAGTLGACWGLLALAGGVWRTRLTARDNRVLAREWARVEPVWSRRRV